MPYDAISAPADATRASGTARSASESDACREPQRAKPGGEHQQAGHRGEAGDGTDVEDPARQLAVHLVDAGLARGLRDR